MNKNRNNFRKCAYCPHHNQQTKCCCRKPNTSTNKSANQSKIIRPKMNSLINESSIRYVDQPQAKFQQINISNLITQNSILKCENKNLKNDLLSISHFVHQQKNPYQKYLSVPTSHTLKTESEQVWSDRLYISNKNLQEAILRVDILSRQNKELNQKNTMLQSQNSASRLENEQLKQEILTLKKQLRKTIQKFNQADKNLLKEEFKILRQKYENLKFENSSLIEQIEGLNKQLQQKRKNNPNNMSPEWIAQTSNKLSFIEQKIQCAQNQIKKKQFNNNINDNKYQNLCNVGSQISLQETQKNQPYFEIMHRMKEELAFSINTIHSKTRKFTSVFDNVGNVQNVNMTSLICSLIQGFVQSCLGLNMALQKQINRKINLVQKKMEHLLGKIQNLVLQIKNRQLRKRSTSRSHIVISNKSGVYSKSPCIRKINKENYNTLNSIDKSY